MVFEKTERVIQKYRNDWDAMGGFERMFTYVTLSVLWLVLFTFLGVLHIFYLYISLSFANMFNPVPNVVNTIMVFVLLHYLNTLLELIKI